MTGRRALLIVVLVLAATAAEPRGSLSALLPDVADETPGFRPAGSPIRADDDGVAFTSRRDGLEMAQIGGPDAERHATLARPAAVVSPGLWADAAGRSIAVTRR